MPTVADYPAGSTQLLLGNEAIARGALEAGVKVAAAYPGTPSTEILETLARAAKQTGIYVEWSVNEKVGAEVAAAAAWTGLRSLTAFKHEGINVALDSLAHLTLTGTKAGFLVIVCDDPGGWSSPSENDSRALARWFNVPLLEPSSPQEALDMARWAFDLSERLGVFVMMRSTTRISHATGVVNVGQLPEAQVKPQFDTSKMYSYHPVVPRHAAHLARTTKYRPLLEEAPFNRYEGPPQPDLMVVASGIARSYAAEAVGLLGLGKDVGILHLGTTWPLPRRVVDEHLTRARRVLVLEEVDPFLEDNLRDLAAEVGWLRGQHVILGKRTGHIESHGELTPDAIMKALSAVTGVEYQPQESDYIRKAQDYVRRFVVDRGTMWCPGCSHRASFFAIKQALRLDGRNGFVTGDIGCYVLDRTIGGFQVTKTGVAMGGGTGVASGMGKLRQFGFDQPVIAVAGDSTFYHACIPPLINARYNRSNFTLVVLDNSATAMTGFQPHAGVGRDALGQEAPVVDIEALCRSLGVPVQVFDPFDLDKTIPALTELLQREDGVHVVIMRRPCTLTRPRDARPDYRMWVEEALCLGQACGCGQYCLRAFKCPGLRWDPAAGVARIDEALCIGCGLCSYICPAGAIRRELANV